MLNDTIAAIITALGPAGVGIIRISGSEALEIGDRVYKGKKSLQEVLTHSVNYGHVYDYKNKEVIDEALFLVMHGPHTFTGEDVVEIQCHGGYVVVQKVLELVLRNGARLAEPGEFSKRAFLNGKLDLSQAEAIMDIVNAKTDQSLKVAINQHQGKLSKTINKLRHNLLELLAYIEADIDFPDDDIERLTNEEIKERILSLRERVSTILATAKRGKIIREGLNVVIIGKPNVGKSSLLNALLKENRAIVTDIPGTTRDAIEEFINLGGVPIKIIDTAGIRDTEDLVEKIGVEKAKEFINKADLVLFVLDILTGVTEADRNILNNYLKDVPTIVLVNKSDLKDSNFDIESIKVAIGDDKAILQISALESEGIDELEKQILELFFSGQIDTSNDELITNVRHVQALTSALDYLESALNSLNLYLPSDFLAIDLKAAWESLGKITGETVEEDLLDQIFSQFCLGK
ncbi:MAG: tRNA uridine-5-carboxymethylaminomethyl(34) synthesis GTPase MnmE [Clostridia bacterium]|nr:tRNA uridine-5-carboxymethylaminomethyl(34) synthesis GTPase MnmE [Clostridia bacterium]